MQKKAKSHILSIKVFYFWNSHKIEINFFKFKAERKILELAERYKELKKSGKVDKFLAKKRKKNLGKANKHLIKNNTVD